MDMLKFREAIRKDSDFGEEGWLKQFENPARSNPIYKKPINEGLYSDVAGAIGAVQDIVWKAAEPLLVSREIIQAIPTKNAIERFPKDIRAYAWISGEAPPLGTGARVETQDIKLDTEISAKKEWSETFAEDSGWNVLAWQIRAIGVAIARLETEKVFAAYKANEAVDAGTVDVTAAAVTWANICDVIQLVENQDFHPTVFVLHPKLFADLMKLDQFISSLYRDTANMRKGVIQHTTLGISFVSSSLCTFTSAGANATYGYCIDTDACGALLVRRDITTKPYEAPDRTMYGVTGSERIGIGILRPKAVARLRGTRT